MKILFILLFFLSGCTTIIPLPEKRQGTMYHYSGGINYKCSLCSQETNLFRLDHRNRVICKKCFQKSNKKWLYH